MAFALDDTLELLARTPSALREQLAGLPTAWSESRPDAENWTAFQVVCHLCYIEEHDWLVRARLINEVGATEAFPPVDHGDASHRYAGQTLEDVLERFAALRQHNLVAITALVTDDEALDHRGLHPTLGEVTMRELLATWAVHDLNHVRQAQEAMAFRYVDEVGPWRANLGVLNRPPS